MQEAKGRDVGSDAQQVELLATRFARNKATHRQHH
jgi:hypothetical protein